MNHLCQDEILLSGVNNRDKAAFELIFREYYRPLCFFACRITSDEDAACDVVQDVFVGLWESRARFEGFPPLRAYLYKCVRRKALNYMEKQNNRARIDLRLHQEQDYQVLQVETEVLDVLHAAIELLPGQCRRVFRLSYIEQLGIRQICDLLGIAESTVKTQRFRAKQILRELLWRKFDM